MRDATFHDQEFTIDRGGGLILYSDGVIERHDEDLDVSIRAMASTLRRIGGTPDASAIFTAVTSPDAFDDATVLALYRDP